MMKFFSNVMTSGTRALCMMAVVASASACAGSSSDASDAGATGSGDTFLAFESDFQNFRSWEKFPVTAPVENSIHLAGPRTEYLNRRPAKGSAAFPVRTIIVKELEVGADVDHKIFAMVKRGGDYNQAGASGWEWFELKNNPDGSESVVWRGLGPPAGEQYGGDPATCNDCHAAAHNNDSVNSTGLSLSNL